MNKKSIIFSDEKKKEIVNYYLLSGLSKLEVQRKFNIKGHSKIKEWMDRFGIGEELELMKDLNKAITKKSVFQALDPSERIKELERALKHEKLRSQAYETMIEIAEKRFKIEIRKKSGAKQ